MLATVSGAVTHLGSSSLLFPLSALYATVLWRRHSPPLALRWLAALALCLAVMGLLKLYGHGCGLPMVPVLSDLLPNDRFISPSGHAAFAAVFYGSAGALAARGVESGWGRTLVLSATAALVAAISLSRILLSAHSAAEVLVGLLVGGLAMLLFLWSCRSLPPARARLSPLLVAAVALAVAALAGLGDPSVIESTIRMVAMHLRAEAGLCMAAGDMAGAELALGDFAATATATATATVADFQPR